MVQYFSGLTDALPDSCGSYVRMEGDNSRLARQCEKWGAKDLPRKWSNSRVKENKAGKRLYDHAAYIFYKYHWNLNLQNKRSFECDDFTKGQSPGNFWKVFVR